MKEASLITGTSHLEKVSYRKVFASFGSVEVSADKTRLFERGNAKQKAYWRSLLAAIQFHRDTEKESRKSHEIEFEALRVS